MSDFLKAVKAAQAAQRGDENSIRAVAERAQWYAAQQQAAAQHTPAERSYWGRVGNNDATKRGSEYPGRRDCTICRGIGHVSVRVPTTDPQFGKVQPCVCMADDVAAYNAKLKSQSIYGRFAPNPMYALGNFAPNGDGTRRMLQAAHAVLRGEVHFALFCGSYGVGKTHLLHAIAAACQTDAIVCALANMLAYINAGINAAPGEPDRETRIQQFVAAPVLCIDEFSLLGVAGGDFRVKMTDAAAEVIARIYDERYEAAKRGFATVLASNENPKAWPGYYADRLKIGLVVANNDESMRTA